MFTFWKVAGRSGREMRARIPGFVVLLLGVILSGAFVSAGVLKIPDPASFRKAVEGFQFLPAGLVPPFSWWIPWLELFLGIFYWLRCFRLASLYGMMFLLGAFCLLLLYAAARGIEIDCGCFGASAGTASLEQNLLRNFFLMGAGSCLIFRTAKERSRTTGERHLH
jgi:Methylamine utilisation protein MauE